MFKRVFLITLASLLLFGCPGGTLTAVGGDEPSQGIQQDLFPAEGTIPLIVLMANSPNPAADFQSVTVYQDYFSSRFSYNAQEYFHQVSYGRFTFAFQGAWGPYNISVDASTDISSTIAEALQGLVDEEFDLAQYDTNRDNVLTTDELLVVTIGNGGQYGGAVRPVVTTLSNGLEIWMGGAIVGSHANLATITHEVSHLLGTIDLYGSNCNSLNLTLMSCTIFGRAGDDTVHLDPWHKMQLNWIEPRIVQLDELGEKTCFDLEVPQYDHESPRHEQQPLLLLDPVHGVDEYFMIEFRNGSFYVPGLLSYERNVPGAGVAVWSIRLNADGFPVQVPSLVQSDGWDASIWTYGSYRDTNWEFMPYDGLDHEINLITPEMAPSRYNRSAHLWSAGYLQPRYQDGTMSGFLIEVRGFNEYSSQVEVCFEQNLLTRFDADGGVSM